MPVAHRAHGGEIARHRRHAPRRRPYHRLGAERGDIIRPQLLKLGLQLGRQPFDILRVALIGRLEVVGEARRDPAERRA